ncbi:MAG TPA: hypothetical protein VFP22_05955, partial [Candidatus Limnocylindrales bacterium]|nr:hypothetical protein [Candidatus Limnocylindrales bacterium]
MDCTTWAGLTAIHGSGGSHEQVSAWLIPAKDVATTGAGWPTDLGVVVAVVAVVVAVVVVRMDPPVATPIEGVTRCVARPAPRSRRCRTEPLPGRTRP